MEFRNRIALVTGGSSGIGLATASLLAAHGAHIWLVARDADRLAHAQAHVALQRITPDQCCQTVVADVARPEQAVAAVAQVTAEAGVPDLVVNSAGIVCPGYFQDLDLAVFHETMEVNYFGTVHVIKAVTPGMIARGSGHIVNISSLAGLIGVFGYTAYGASKFAIRGFSDALRAELKPLGIGVSIVFPPDTDTPQLAYENEFKPYETRALASGARTLSAESVAAEILTGVSRGQYMIIPGSEGKVLYRLSGLVGPQIYSIMDVLIARAQRRQKVKT